MTSGRDPIAQSIHDRLKRAAVEQREDFTAILARYGNERFLYRLSRTPHRERFVLKGAMLFVLWLGRNYRPTQDIDLAGSGEVTEERMRSVFADVCAVKDQSDGLFFDPASITVEQIREGQPYRGLRVKVRGKLRRSRINVQVDVGAGDAITGDIAEVDYPTLLGQSAPRLKVYPIVTVVAEKFDAMLQLGSANSRMKDFFDLWLMSRSFQFDGAVLSDAIRRTCERRQTVITAQPVCLSDAFMSDTAKQALWSAFVRRGRLLDAPGARGLKRERTGLGPWAVRGGQRQKTRPKSEVRSLKARHEARLETGDWSKSNNRSVSICARSKAG